MTKFRLHSKWVILAIVTVFLSSPLFSEINIRIHNNFLSYTNFEPGKNAKYMDTLFAVIGDPSYLNQGIISEAEDMMGFLNSQDTSLMTQPLFYPSPFRFQDGSNLHFRLNKTTELDLRIYDIRGDEVARKGKKMYYIGSNVINIDSLGIDSLPASVYFFILLEGDNVLGKGKFAVLP